MGDALPRLISESSNLLVAGGSRATLDGDTSSLPCQVNGAVRNESAPHGAANLELLAGNGATVRVAFFGMTK